VQAHLLMCNWKLRGQIQLLENHLRRVHTPSSVNNRCKANQTI
jgi:hypothetical protein